MSRIYDNWERLVEATLKIQQLRDLALCESFSSRASDFSFDSFREHVAEASRFPCETSNLSYRGKSNSNSLLTQKAEILSSPSAKPFSFNLLKYATRKFQPGNLLAEGAQKAEILSSPGAKSFLFNELKYATRQFEPGNLLAEGAFSLVFKGWIDEHTLTAVKPGSGLAIAVKKLKLQEFIDQVDWLWLRKVKRLGQLCHPNLVKLIGYCFHEVDSFGDEIRLLVYEFMPEGSLRKHLSRKGASCTLSWGTRISVAIGVARGLSFLHEGDPQLILGVVKSSNILLDGDFGAKLSCFTLTKLPPPLYVLPGSWSPRPHGDISPASRDANEYDAPEYILTGKLTAKCDVYSFGVILIELLCGRCASQLKKSVSGEQDLVEWARPCLVSKQKLFRELMDYGFVGQYPKKKANKVAILASQCVSSDPKERPCMKEVLGALEKIAGSKNWDLKKHRF